MSVTVQSILLSDKTSPEAKARQSRYSDALCTLLASSTKPGEIGVISVNDYFNSLAGGVHLSNVQCGWWDNIETGEPANRNVFELLALIHSELSEALEAARKDLNDDHLPNRKGIEVELADAVIRIFDLAGAMNLDLGGALIEKLQYNRSRADHKIENRKLKNGKKA